MRLLSKEELKELIKIQEENCITIYLPTEKSGRETQMNPIRLKNLVNRVEKKLVKKDLASNRIDRLLSPAKTLIENGEFWQHQAEGLVLFITDDHFRYYRLPLRFKEYVMINRRFHLKPLLPLFSGEGHFYILALSQKQIRLWQASRFSYHEIDLGEIPTSMEEALGYDNLERKSQAHVARRRGKQRADLAFHGHGGGADDVKEDIQRYFQRVSKGLQRMMTSENDPMVLAGVEYITTLFKMVSGYNFILEKAITGNPDELPSEELHRRAWQIVEPDLKSEQEKAFNQYRDLSQTARTADCLPDILPAAAQGRVGWLFVDVAAHIWGTYQSETGQVEVHRERGSNRDELIDLAAFHTLTHGGRVYACQKKEMPGSSPAVAVFRW
jgi:hypothetical protein